MSGIDHHSWPDTGKTFKWQHFVIPWILFALLAARSLKKSVN
jgi:hypothetical protein